MVIETVPAYIYYNVSRERIHAETDACQDCPGNSSTHIVPRVPGEQLPATRRPASRRKSAICSGVALEHYKILTDTSRGAT